MKPVLLFLLSVFSLTATAQKGSDKVSIPDSTKKIEVVETACGQCRFHLPGKGCSLAVRMNGTAYFVDGTDIDSHGDAHAKDGFCNAISKAQVQGEVVNGRFKATYFKLLKEVKKKSN